jgi:small subunit ribosomal protein S30
MEYLYNSFVPRYHLYCKILGFSTFNELTYPLTTQTVITDGKWWSFFVYQLNTVLLHNAHIEDNPKRNICWITKPMKLFDKIENEKVHGLNEELLKTLIKFYANAPEERSGINLKPYLGESVKVIADIEHDEKRNWLETHYKHLMCNRKRHKCVLMLNIVLIFVHYTFLT